jgi:hypothetical protein
MSENLQNVKFFYRITYQQNILYPEEFYFEELPLNGGYYLNLVYRLMNASL